MPMIFYVIVAAARLNLGDLRRQGWIFDMGNSGQESWTDVYSYFGVLFVFLFIYFSDRDLLSLFRRVESYSVWPTSLDSSHSARFVRGVLRLAVWFALTCALS
jgi:hypothetical protein